MRRIPFAAVVLTLALGGCFSPSPDTPPFVVPRVAIPDVDPADLRLLAAVRASEESALPALRGACANRTSEGYLRQLDTLTADSRTAFASGAAIPGLETLDLAYSMAFACATGAAGDFSAATRRAALAELDRRVSSDLANASATPRGPQACAAARGAADALLLDAEFLVTQARTLEGMRGAEPDEDATAAAAIEFGKAHRRFVWAVTFLNQAEVCGQTVPADTATRAYEASSSRLAAWPTAGPSNGRIHFLAHQAGWAMREAQNRSWHEGVLELAEIVDLHVSFLEGLARPGEVVPEPLPTRWVEGVGKVRTPGGLLAYVEGAIWRARYMSADPFVSDFVGFAVSAHHLEPGERERLAAYGLS